MKKSEFKKILKKENNSAKNYAKYGGIVTFIYIFMLAFILVLEINNIIATNVRRLFSGIILFFVAIPTIIIDVQNDIQIKKLYEIYKKENKIENYVDKTKYFKKIIIVELVILLIAGTYISTKMFYMTSDQNYEEMENSLEIITNKGNVIETQYEDLGTFSLKIPKDFKPMSVEAIKLKYPNGNPPTLVYSNENGTINLTFNINSDALLNESEIEEFTKYMEDLYIQYYNATETNIEFFKRNNNKFGKIEFMIEAQDTDIYNQIIFFSEDGYLRLIGFNCTKDYIDEWKEVGSFIMDSIKVK